MPDRDAYTVAMDAPALNAFLARAFPHATPEDLARIDRVSPGEVLLSRSPGVANLRPGGIVSGPTLMGLADVAAYAAVLAHIGEIAMAVTSSLNYQFLQPCPHETIRAQARLLKLSRRQAVVDVHILADSVTGSIGQAIVTYAIPRPKAPAAQSGMNG